MQSYQKVKSKIFSGVLLIFLGLFLTTNMLQAQGDLQDVVYLKNGSIVRGIIIEQVPNESLKIQTAGGSLFVYKFEEIEKITKEAPSSKSSAKKTKSKSGTNNSDNRMIIAPYFSIGVTAIPPSAEDLEYDYPDLYERDMNPLAIGGGMQMLFALKKLWIGFDVGAKRTFNSTSSYDMELIYSTGYSTQIDKETTINILFLTEYKLSDLFFLQGGLGPYMTSWFYSYEYTNPEYYSSYDYNEYTGTKWNFGIMLAGGADLPITDVISIPLYLRFDIMFRYGVMIPITLNSGVRFKL